LDTNAPESTASSRDGVFATHGIRAYLNARFSTDEDFRRRVQKLEELETFRP
jgi:ribose 5-phosphate isomerase RpiB